MTSQILPDSPSNALHFWRRLGYLLPWRLVRAARQRGFTFLRLGLTCLVLCFCAQFAAADTSEQQSPLVGTWRLQSSGAKLAIEFRADGEYRAITALGGLQGQWRDVDGRFVQTWSDDQRPKRVNAYSVDGDELIITDELGVQHRHLRIASPAR